MEGRVEERQCGSSPSDESWDDDQSSLGSDAAEFTSPSSKRPSQGRLALWLRSRVSQNKQRFKEDGFDLDLSYITPRIIAMGFPAHGKEYYLRNPIDQVEAFFDARHAGHYRIYNLCSERQYDSPERFHGCFKRFPFDDHNTPSLSLMVDFVADATAFLKADAVNVVAVHCKAGKGRTGLMVCCLLRAFMPEQFRTAQEAIEHFDSKRTLDGVGMTIPSQQRYVGYFERILKEHGGVPPAPRQLQLYQVIVDGQGLHSLANPHDFYFSVWINNKKTIRSKKVFPDGPVTGKVGCVFVFPDPAPVLCGDIKFLFHRRKNLISLTSPPPCFYLWLNTAFCPERLVLHRDELDKVDRSIFDKDLTVDLVLHNVDE